MAEQTPLELPIITLREVVMFPHAVMTFHVGRSASVSAINSAVTEYDKQIFLVAQTSSAIERPGPEDLFQMGVVSRVLRADRLQDNTIKLVCEGLYRASWLPLNASSAFGDRAFPRLRTVRVEETLTKDEELPAVVEALQESLSEACRQNRRITPEQLAAFALIEDPGTLADAVAPCLKVDYLHKQAILEMLDQGQRLRQVYEYLGGELISSSIDKTIKSRVKAQMEQNQKEYYLTEQLKAINKELGHDDIQAEILELEEKLKVKNMPEDARERALREVRKLRQMPPASSEYVVARNYVDWIIDLPWNELKKIDIDLDKARAVLDGGHYGLEKAKTRILEYLAVQKLSGGLKGPILCLVGPPGVGKTSIAMSMARALNRKLARISLGGVHDEAEIRGHRKTYVGAMPGRIIAAVKQAESCNPLLLLDEIDKLGNDQRGDPASALLEVLDAEQNSTFRDHFLEVPFDLSDVLFITTANTLDTIPRPLLDRMEVIELTSYTDEEKLQIAKRHLLPKELKRHGLTKAQLRLTDDAIRELIRGYTREAGVRVLERKLGALCRKAAMDIVSNGVKSIHITGDNLEDYLGIRRYHPERLPRTEQVGVVNGLAWTQVGGEILEVEAGVVPGSGKVELTGNLGSVMKESAQAALSYIRSRAVQLGIEADFYKTKDIHVHFPEGAVPKDGPSAGIAITTAMVSALTGAPVRREIAMTGEVTLRGRVLHIGGLKEKTMAAYRNGIKTVFLPADNVPDLEEIDPTVRAALHFVPVEQVDSVLAEALELKTCDPLRDDALPPPESGSRSREVPTFRQ